MLTLDESSDSAAKVDWLPEVSCHIAWDITGDACTRGMCSMTMSLLSEWSWDRISSQVVVNIFSLSDSHQTFTKYLLIRLKYSRETWISLNFLAFMDVHFVKFRVFSTLAKKLPICDMCMLEKIMVWFTMGRAPPWANNINLPIVKEDSCGAVVLVILFNWVLGGYC